MQCLKKLCHDLRHEISFHLIYGDSIFYHNFLEPDWQISCHLYHFYLFAFRFALCALPNGQHEPRNVVAYQAIIEPYLLARPKMGLNNQIFENLHNPVFYYNLCTFVIKKNSKIKIFFDLPTLIFLTSDT